MKVSILNKEFEFNSLEEGLENILYVIYKEAGKRGHFIDYLIVDGKTVKQNFIDYVDENLDNIDHIEVVTLSIKDSILTSIMGFKDFVSEQIDSINMLSESLKRGDIHENLLHVEVLIEGLSIIVFQFEKIDSMSNLSQVIPDYMLWNELAVEIMKIRALNMDIELSAAAEDGEQLVYLFTQRLEPIFENMNEILEKMVKYSSL